VPLFADPTITVIDVPGAAGTQLFSINRFGTVTGSYYDSSGQHGFVRDPSGTITTFDVPGSTRTSPAAINIVGTIVGSWNDANFTHSFMRDAKGTITAFDPPQCSSSAQSINAEGAIVGMCGCSQHPPYNYGYVRNPDGTFSVFDVKDFSGNTSFDTYAHSINVAYLVTGYYDSPSGPYGFVGWPNSHFITFNVPGSGANPVSINSFGAITGSSGPSGFVRDPLGKIVSFDAPGSVITVPAAINDAGAIVGYSDDTMLRHGFVRDSTGAITSFDPPSSHYTYPMSINDQGVITGWFLNVGGNTLRYSGFVRTP
jgi:hypothetical protein